MSDHIVIGDIRPRVQYTADGTQTVFTYPFPIFAPEDLKVYLGEALQGGGYTVAGAGQSAGGSVTFAPAPAAATRVTLVRALSIARTSDFQEGGAFRAKTLNDELDRQTAFIQEAAERIERALVAAPTETAAPLVLPPAAERANALLGFDAAGAPLAAGGSGAVAISAAMTPVVQATTLAAARSAMGATAVGAALYTAADEPSARAALKSFRNERLAKTGAYTVANADRGKTIACGAGPWTLAFGAPAGYDADFLALVLNESATRALKVDLNGAAFWLYPAQTALVYAQGGAWRALRPERWKLAANTTLYVDVTNGNNNNDGLAAGAGNALQTIQAAWDVIFQRFDLAGFAVTVQLADGTYTSGGFFAGKCVGQASPASIVFQGNSGTPANVTVSVSASTCFVLDTGAHVTIKDLKVTATSPGSGISVTDKSTLYFGNINFGACTGGFHIYADGSARVFTSSNYAISGGAQAHWFSNVHSYLLASGRTITLSGTPAFSTAFAMALYAGAVQCNGNTYSGSATGKRYDSSVHGTIDTFGAGANYLPGNVAGTVANNGLYL